MVTDLTNLARNYGIAVEAATLARDLLAPAAARLSGDDPSGLHRRCILVRYHGFFLHPDEARADLAKFGDIEAVAACRTLHTAVVVFRNADNATTALWRHAVVVLRSADNATAAAALGKQQPLARLELYSPVPPLYLCFPVCLIHPDLIEVTTYPVRPVFVLQNTTPTARPRGSARGPPGTTEFVPFFKSKVEGPRVGDDGQLWMDGFKFTYYEKGMQIDHASVPVIQVAPSTD